MRNTDKEPAKYERREERLFRQGFEWFYHIRAGQRGPFASKEAARRDLAEYLATVRYFEDNPDRLPEDVDGDEITHIEIKPPPY